MCAIEQESINHVFTCDAFINENADILSKWGILDVCAEDFFRCGNKRTWKKRALKAKLIKRTLNKLEAKNQAIFDLSEETMMENDDEDSDETTTSRIGNVE